MMFKQCSMCSHVWKSREEFLNDNTMKLNGYQVHFKSVEDSLFLFTHEIDQCGSTLAIPAREFLDMYSGERYLGQGGPGVGDCPGYCLHEDRLDRCNAICECAYVREVLHIIGTKP